MEKIPVEPDIELEFQGIDFETYTTEDGEYVYDEVLIHLRNTGDKNVHKSYHYKIFYLHKDKWYGVYQFTDGTLLAYQASYKPKTEKDISFLVPTGLFDVPGQYKLYYEDTGFCDIDILFSPNDVSKAKSETTERIS